MIGQESLLSDSSTLRRLIDKGAIPSLVLWGPVSEVTLGNLLFSQDAVKQLLQRLLLEKRHRTSFHPVPFPAASP
jgi:replication-associated recombination protein RarA